MNEALGMIETIGLIAAIEASDVMLKVADVRLIKKEIVKGGLVTVFIVGDVAAVQTAVAAGASAIERLNPYGLQAFHVIPCPDKDVSTMIDEHEKQIQEDKVTMIEAENIQETINAINSADIALSDESEIELENIVVNVDTVVDVVEQMKKMLQEQKMIEANEELFRWKLVDIRAFAKEIVDFSMSKQAIYKRNKQDLIEAILKHFVQ